MGSIRLVRLSTELSTASRSDWRLCRHFISAPDSSPIDTIWSPCWEQTGGAHAEQLLAGGDVVLDQLVAS